MKLDRLGWAAGLSFVSHDACIGIRVNEPAVLELLAECLPPESRPAPSPIVETLYSLVVGGHGTGSTVRRYNLLYVGALRLARTMDLDELFAALESDLHFRVALTARSYVFVHAGVVGWRDRAIVIPGRSYSGKTTLVRALVEAGATYYSDEFAVVDAQGRVHPYPKPLFVREGDDGRRRRFPPEALGGAAGTVPLPVGLVAVTKYERDARWRPRVLSAGQGLLALLDNTVQARIRPGAALATLKAMVAGATVLKSRRGGAREVASSLLRRLDDTSALAGTFAS